MRSLHLSPTRVRLGLLGFTLIVNLLVLLIPHFDPFKAILGLGWLIFMPGWLLTRLLQIRTPYIWERIGFMAGLGILATMLTGLLVNAVLPLFGDGQPLDTTGLLLGFDIVWIGLLALEAGLGRHRPVTIPIPRLNMRAIGFALAGLPTIILAAMGAVSLNNQGPNTLTVIMLIYAASYLGVMVYLRNRLPESALLAGLYQVALALLLMTSLRGWYTTGHDIQREYRVFILALSNLHWDINSYRDAYNACISVTILPAIFRQITGIPETFIFKTIFQAIFALVPVLVYSIGRRHLGSLAAALGAIYFIAFPTYFGDMPFLNRQEIAFLFMTLIFLTVVNTKWTPTRRRWLVGVLSIGVVLSHYSTTYTMIALFIGALILRYGLRFLARHVEIPKFRRLFALHRWEHYRTATVTLVLVISMLAVSYVWGSQLTNTGNNISNVAADTFLNIRKGLSNESKSSDTGYSLFAKNQPTDQERLDMYASQVIPKLRQDIGVENLYPTASLNGFHPVIATPAILPLTSLGQSLSNLGVPVATLNGLLRQGSAAFLQVALIVGIIVLFIKRPFKLETDNEYRLFQLAGVLFVAAIIILPTLSAEYGLLRAFQQVLVLGGGAIALATIVFFPARLARGSQIIAAAFAIGFFASSTGVITSLFGGYGAQLHLANSGKYYDLYYAHESEQHAIAWLSYITGSPDSSEQVSSSIETDRYTLGRLAKFTGLSVEDDIYPATIPVEAYVFVGYGTLHQHTAVIYSNGDPLTYIYPMNFLDDNKDLIYSSGGARIYR